MRYQDALNWMFEKLPMYQKEGKKAFKKDLINITLLAKKLNNPEKKIKTIHVAGTNGKGSTSHMIASVLQEAGYKVGLYTSPHLKNFTERIRINGKEIQQEYVATFISEHKEFLERQNLSFFEMTVGMAFDYFENQKVDIAVIEVGLGGRLDSTNIIMPEISVITNIGLDHTKILGETLSKIANEKAGIIKNNIPVVIGERQEAVENVFLSKAITCNSQIMFASDGASLYETDLLGNYQSKNVKTAVKALQQLKGFTISEENIKNGLLNVVKNTNLKGRWQILEEQPKVICDTAHNKEGLIYTLAQLQEEDFEKLHIVLGVVSDKDLTTILPVFPKKAIYYFCKPNVSRGFSEKKLKNIAQTFDLIGTSFDSVNQAFEVSKLNATKKDVIYIGGSTFVVAEIL